MESETVWEWAYLHTPFRNFRDAKTFWVDGAGRVVEQPMSQGKN